MLEPGKTYYFWDNTRNRLGSLEITELQQDHFYFTYHEIEKPGRGTYDLESSLYLSRWDVPEYRRAMLRGTDREGEN